MVVEVDNSPVVLDSKSFVNPVNSGQVFIGQEHWAKSVDVPREVPVPFRVSVGNHRARANIHFREHYE